MLILDLSFTVMFFSFSSREEERKNVQWRIFRFQLFCFAKVSFFLFISLLHFLFYFLS